MYKEWLVKYGKLNNSLGVSENDKRFKIFKDNLRFIDQHNSENRTYKVGLNQFADLSNEEYQAIYLGARFDERTIYPNMLIGGFKVLFCRSKTKDVVVTSTHILIGATLYGLVFCFVLLIKLYGFMLVHRSLYYFSFFLINHMVFEKGEAT
jgi:hypothetical protein